MANNALTIGVVAGLVLAAFVLVLAIGGANENLDGFSDDNISVTIETPEQGGEKIVLLTPNEENTPRGWVVRVLTDDGYQFVGTAPGNCPLMLPYNGDTYKVTFSLFGGNSVYYIIDTNRNTITIDDVRI